MPICDCRLSIESLAVASRLSSLASRLLPVGFDLAFVGLIGFWACFPFIRICTVTDSKRLFQILPSPALWLLGLFWLCFWQLLLMTKDFLAWLWGKRMVFFPGAIPPPTGGSLGWYPEAARLVFVACMSFRFPLGSLNGGGSLRKPRPREVPANGAGPAEARSPPVRPTGSDGCPLACLGTSFGRLLKVALRHRQSQPPGAVRAGGAGALELTGLLYHYFYCCQD